MNGEEHAGCSLLCVMSAYVATIVLSACMPLYVVHVDSEVSNWLERGADYAQYSTEYLTGPFAFCSLSGGCG